MGVTALHHRGGPGLVRALHGEWTKLRTLPSTGWLLLGLVASTVGLGAVTTWSIPTDCLDPDLGCREDLARVNLTGVYLAQIAVVVLAALAVTAEYGTQTIRVTLTAEPRRGLVFVAKAIVVTALVAGAGTVGVLGALAAGRPILSGNGFTTAAGYPPLSLGDEPTLRAAGGTVLYLLLVGLLSLGIGMSLRHTPAVLATVLSALFVWPIAASLLSGEWAARVMKYAPMNAGLAIQATERLDDLLIGPWQGLGVLAAYAAGTLLTGAVVFSLRDA
ncbi:ABC transporter permease [Phytohabitans sp. ZYX-F-186]|uniref:ABC transporter permease n=1 Tax=Phytohabitans maris TaxID=3071409 RepID=A0ABU0ZKY5_9ACTN|nr:ABC transporter permease [Phytohabitans sp. ZYX-F-186]MDQ7907695.1 ABC transporter permease [Phytohabitans sp. ZYX-F-186]